MSKLAAPRGRSALTIELLTWLRARPRTYDETIDAWRSNCPRHSVWDDALAAGLVRVIRNGRRSESLVTLTPLGSAALDGRP
jgi:hypothetical protein